MFVLHTREVRWFYEGSLPAGLLTSFQDVAVPGIREHRVDWYFVGGARPDLGLKVREGSWFDIKQRGGVDPDRAFGATMRGDVEDWTKWSFALDSDAGCLPLGSVDRGWCRVEKTRWVRRYQFAATGHASAVSIDNDVESGCNVELADVVVDDAAGWSLGLEAFGPIELLDAALTTAVAAFITETPALTDASFDSDDSQGYPSWLIRAI